MTGVGKRVRARRHRLEGHVVVVSPHLDDAALSLGAALARAARDGARIEVLSVLAGDPESEAPAGGWDRKAGFATEGEAAQARRQEDREACTLLGATPTWLALGDSQYDRHGTEHEVWAAVRAACAGADAVLLPGFPLATDDHGWLSEILLRKGLPAARVGLYVEQPYEWRAQQSVRPMVPDRLRPIVRASDAWRPLASGVSDRRLKLEAIRAYRTQVVLLRLSRRRGLPLYRMLAHEAFRGGERLAWIET